MGMDLLPVFIDNYLLLLVPQELVLERLGVVKDLEEPPCALYLIQLALLLLLWRVVSMLLSWS